MNNQPKEEIIVNEINKKLVAFEKIISFLFDNDNSKIKNDYNMFLKSLYLDDYFILKIKFRIILEKILKKIIGKKSKEEISLYCEIEKMYRNGDFFIDDKELKLLRHELNNGIHYEQNIKIVFWDFFLLIIYIIDIILQKKENYSKKNLDINNYVTEYGKHNYFNFSNNEQKNMEYINVDVNYLITNDFFILKYKLCSWEFRIVIDNIKYIYQDSGNQLWLEFYKNNNKVVILNNNNDFYSIILLSIFKNEKEEKNIKKRILEIFDNYDNYYEDIFGDVSKNTFNKMKEISEKWNNKWEITLINNHNLKTRLFLVKKDVHSNNKEMSRIDYILSIVFYLIQRREINISESKIKEYAKYIKSVNLNNFELKYLLWTFSQEKEEGEEKEEKKKREEKEKGEYYDYQLLEKNIVESLIGKRKNPLKILQKIEDASKKIKELRTSEDTQKRDFLIQINYIFNKSIMNERRMNDNIKFFIYEYILEQISDSSNMEFLIKKLLIIAVSILNLKGTFTYGMNNKNPGDRNDVERSAIFKFSKSIENFIISNKNKKPMLRTEWLKHDFWNDKYFLKKFIDYEIVSKIYSYSYFGNKKIINLLSEESKFNKFFHPLFFSRYEEGLDLFIMGWKEEDNNIIKYKDSLSMNSTTWHFLKRDYNFKKMEARENNVTICENNSNNLYLNEQIGCNDRFLNILDKDPEKVIKEVRLFYNEIRNFIKEYIDFRGDEN